MKSSKSSNQILVSRSSQTLSTQKSFILHNKDFKNNYKCQSGTKLNQMYTEAQKSFEQGEYENALIKFGCGAKMNPNNKRFMLGVKKSKDAILNDLATSENTLKHLQDEITKYPSFKSKKEINFPFTSPNQKSEKKHELEHETNQLIEMKSETMKAAVSRIKEKKLEPIYNLTIHDGTTYKTVKATTHDVKEYLRDKNYFKSQQSRKEWKKKLLEFNKRITERKPAQMYEREAKLLEEKCNIQHHCEEQINLIGRQYQNGRMADVTRFCENFIKYLNKKTDKSLPKKWMYLATTFNYLARANAELGEYEKAKTYGEKLYKIAITSNNTELIAQSYILSGKIYVKCKKYKEAAFVWEKLIPILEDNEKKAWLYHEIGRCYYEMEKFDISSRYGMESAQWASKCDSSTWMCAANVLLGQIEMKRNNIEEALDKLVKAKKYAAANEDEQTINYISCLEEKLHILIQKKRSKTPNEN